MAMAVLIPMIPEILAGATALVGTIGALIHNHRSNNLKDQVTDLEAKLQKLSELLMTSDTENSGLKQLRDGLKDQVATLEKRLKDMTTLSEKSNQNMAAAEVKFCRIQDELLEEQAKLKDRFCKEKKEMEKVQAERERSMKERHEQWERERKANVKAEEDHQRRLAKEAEEGLKRSHDEYERHMALERERLAKEEEFLTNAHLEHERCLEEERERFHQSQINYEKVMEEDRKRLTEEMKTFQEAQEKWDSDRVMLEQNYKEIQRNLDAGYQQLRRDQRDVEKRLQSKMEDLMAEQKNLTVLEKEEKLKDLTETYLRYCEMYAEDREALTMETKEFQRKFMSQLTRVKNSMPTGDKSLSRFKVWAKGAVLAMKMLTFLSHSGEVKQSTIQAAAQQYRRDMSSMVSTFNAPNALPCNADEIRAVEDSFHDQLQGIESYISRALPASSSPHLAIQATAATSGNIHSPTWTEITGIGGGVSTFYVQRDVQFRPLQQSVQEDQPSDWARCDAISQALRQSICNDQPHFPGSDNSTRNDALESQSLQQSAFEDQP